MVRRAYVEKKPGFDVEAQALLSDLREHLELDGLQQVRILNRYDISGVDEAEFQAACAQVFAEAAVDTVGPHFEAGSSLTLAVEFLPGQYDQRADSAAQCLQLITQKERPLVRSAKVYLFEGIQEQDLEKVRHYLINPVECREASLELPESLEMQSERPADVEVITGFIFMDDGRIAAFHKERGFAMSVADLCFCRDYFKSLSRDPSITELKVIDTYWSDHCRHTTFSTRLDDIVLSGEDEVAMEAIQQAILEYVAARREVYGEDGAKKRPVTLMDMGTIVTKQLKKQGRLPDLDESEEINACSIKVPVTIDGEQRDYLIMFKNETHNHPTEIEPFGGAATCLGGAIRDPLSGRSYVYQAMRVTGAGDPRSKNTLPGKLSQRRITTGAAAGYSSYGNQIGLATGKVAEVYHEGFVAKRMEVGAVIAAAPAENVIRERPAPGDVVLLLGGRTGRDGMGGATGSSKAHTEESLTTCGAEVQKGNPLTERKLQRLYRNKNFSTLVKRCNDFGAGGVCVAIGELADGLSIDLDAVPKKYEGLDGTELAIAESQERMAVVVRAEDVEKVMALCAEENLEATLVAKVTEDPRLVMHWRGKTIVNVERKFLDTNGVPQEAEVEIQIPDRQGNPLSQSPAATRENFFKAISDLNACSQKGLGERFDATIGAGSVLMPFGGKYQLTPAQAMAALVPVNQGQCSTATLMAYGYDPKLSSYSPYHGAAYAVVDCVTKLVASGADYRRVRLSFQEYFERLKGAASWGKPVAALMGAQQAQRGLGTPAIGGKDSMSGSFGELHVPPTLVSFGVAPIEAAQVLSNEFKQAGSQVVLFKAPRKEALSPDYDGLRAMFEKVQALLGSGKALSAAAVSSLAVTVLHSCFGNGLGFEFAQTEDLFVPQYGSIMVELAAGEEIPQGAPLLGHTLGEGQILCGGEKIALAELCEAWQAPLEKVFATRIEQQGPACEQPLYSEKSSLKPRVKIAKPLAVLPVFPGTNCEFDTARAIEKAGGQAQILVLRNLTAADIEESAKALVEAIQQAQMVVLPGGFSGGDEPDGSGKFITAVFRNPRVSEAVMELLKNRDGLMLGICNGFQALVKLGLVPYGEIRPMGEDSPTLTFNRIHRHASCIIRTQVSSVKSPWFNQCEAGEIHSVAISHGEGRFVGTEQELEQLFKAGQVATQYVDLSGKPSMDIRFNPNGSMYAIEGITSPDGRVLGKMGHSERSGKYLYKNVDGDYDQKIFLSGVEYFG